MGECSHDDEFLAGIGGYGAMGAIAPDAGIGIMRAVCALHCEATSAMRAPDRSTSAKIENGPRSIFQDLDGKKKQSNPGKPRGLMKTAAGSRALGSRDERRSGVQVWGND